MRPSYKRLSLVCVLAIAAVAGAWALYPRIAYPRAPDRPDINMAPGSRPAKITSPTISVSARSPRPGEILLSATASITHPFRDATLWHNVVVRRLDGSGGAEQVWAHSFDGVLPDGTPSVKLYTNAPRGKLVKADLPEFRIPVQFAPGGYAIFVEVVEDAPEAGPEGITNQTHGLVGRTAVVIVK